MAGEDPPGVGTLSRHQVPVGVGSWTWLQRHYQGRDQVLYEPARLVDSSRAR